jgi:RNA polymerase sigma-70 factor, ECF subfamily
MKLMIPEVLRPKIDAVLERCHNRFPTVDLQAEVFLARVDEAVSAGTVEAADPAAWCACFEALHHEDLFLACACAQGDRIAWEHFADEYMPLVRRFARAACSPQNSGDLAQQLVARLLEDRAKLAGYNGRGSLAGWLRVAIAHAAVDQFRRGAREVSLEQLEQSGGAIPSPPAPAAEDERWGPVICDALAAAISGLSARDRLLLTLYYLNAVPLKAIGRHFSVHEGTASRWLDALRRSLRKSVEKELRIRHGLRPGDIRSIWERAADGDWFSLRKELARAQGDAGRGADP